MEKFVRNGRILGRKGKKKKMKLYITKKYYKTSIRGREPIRYKARQKKVGTDIHATIRMDPVLKKYPDLRKVLLQHEKTEIREWGKGKTGGHRAAVKKEPKILRKIGGVSGLWREIKRRERKRK